MPECPTCGKHYERNSAHFREHVAMCSAKSTPRILDAATITIPTPKVPMPQPPVTIKKTTETAEIQKTPPAEKAEIQKPGITRPVRGVGSVSDGAKLGFKSLYITSALLQSRMSGTIKDLDKKIYEKRRDYAIMLDEMLEKRGIHVNLPVELRFGVELSTDVFRAFKDRIDDPLTFDQIRGQTDTRENKPIPHRPANDYADIDKLFN